MIQLPYQTEEKKGNMLYEELLQKYNEQTTELNSIKAELTTTKVELANAQIQLNNLRRIVFGSKREKLPKQDVLESGDQCCLFENMKDIDENLEKQSEEKIEEIIVHRKKNAKKKKAGIKKAFLKNVTINRNEYVLNEDEKCPECNSSLTVVGKKVVRQEIEYISPKIEITEYVQYIYKCNECGTKNSKKDTCTFVKADVPKPLLTHSFVSPSLATEVMYQKYYLGVPLYRQEKMWDDKGLVLPRNMMANWVIKISEYYLEPFYNLMAKQLKRNNELLHCDESSMQCNKEPGRNASSKSYMWVIRSGDLEKQKGVIFRYSASRSANVAQDFLSGFNGILVTDGYAGYNNVEVKTHAECWAHARRYFYESIPLLENKQMDTSCDGYKGVTYCDKLFAIEEKIAKLGGEEKKKVRQGKSKVILDDFFAWVEDILNNKIVLNKKLKEALVYAHNQRKELSEFLNDGRIPLTNSAAERAVRPFAVHRKNWLFADTVEGAKANAVLYSIVETAKANSLNIHKYIEFLLENLPQLENINDEQQLSKYLPWSKELPQDILNFQGAPEGVTITE